MIFDWNSEVIRDTKNRKIFHIKKSDTYFLLDTQQSRSTDILSKILINAFSLAAIIGYTLHLDYWAWGVIAAVLYAMYIAYFNLKVFPNFSQIKQKHVIAKEKKSTHLRILVSSIGLMLVGAGLLICVYLQQVNGLLNIIFIVGCGMFALVIGLSSLIKNLRKKPEIALSL